MKKNPKIGKVNKLEVAAVTFLLILVFKAWSSLPQLLMRSDGFVYMLLDNQYDYWRSSLPITGIQAAAHMSGAFLPKLFGVNLSYYYWLEIFFLLLIAFLFYIFVKVLTKNYLIAFVASLIASTSYFGVYDMVSTHCYCYFLERIIVIPFLLISITLLHLFLEYGKRKYYLYSLLFYILGIGLGYFNLLFTPVYILYPFFFEFLKKDETKKLLKGISYAFPYLLLSGIFNIIHLIRDGSIAPINGLLPSSY